MRNLAARSVVGLVSLTMSLSLIASKASADTLIPLRAHNQLATFYISVGVGDHADDYLVDTGAGYMTITTETLERSQAAGTATYLRELDGRMADGSVLRVPLYRLSEITIGNSCQLRDVEVAVLPGASRGLLGLSALRRTSPFEFSVDPPMLKLSNCTLQTAAID